MSGGPTGPAGTERYDVNAAIDRILDEGASRYMRALHLYEFCCAIYLCVPPPEGEGDAAGDGSFTVDVPLHLLRTARAVAAMRLMRSIEVSAAPPDGDRDCWPLPFECPPDPDYRQLFEVFWRNGRWRTMLRVAELEQHLAWARWEAHNLGRTLGFSVRFEPTRARPRTTGGITAATEYAPEDQYFGVKRSTSTLREIWSRRQRAAVWYYLVSVEKFPFLPPLPTDQRFVRHLLNRVAGDLLKEGFATYTPVRERLRERGYSDFPPVACRTELPESSWAPTPLPAEVLERLGIGDRRKAR